MAATKEEIGVEDGPRDWEVWWCPSPVTEAPRESMGMVADRLEASNRRRERESSDDATSVADLLRRLDSPRSSDRVVAQALLEKHEGSSLRWRASNEAPAAGPWFTGALYLCCKKEWLANSTPQYNRFEDLAHDVYVEYVLRVGSDSFAGFAFRDRNRPWQSLCAYFRTAARHKLTGSMPQSISHVAKLTIKDLKDTRHLLADARAALTDGGATPAWLAALAGERHDRNAMVAVLSALLEPGTLGASLSLTGEQEELARSLIRLHPRRAKTRGADTNAENTDDDDDNDDDENGESGEDE